MELTWSTNGVDHFFWVVICVSVFAYVLRTFLRTPSVTASSLIAVYTNGFLAAMIILATIYVGMACGALCVFFGYHKIFGYLFVLLILAGIPHISTKISVALTKNA